MAKDPEPDKKDKDKKGDPLPKFRHIHCSSRFDRSAESLDNDLDDWREHSSIITLTEVDNNNRRAVLGAKGWGYWNSPKSRGQDNCAICWDSDVWRCQFRNVRKLNNVPFTRSPTTDKLSAPLYSCSVVLKRVNSKHKVLVSVTHMPAHVEGPNRWRHIGDHWQARKRAYLTSVANWADYTVDLERKHPTDAQLIVADWNLDLKNKWVQDMLDAKWGKGYYQLAWSTFPSSGGSMTTHHTPPPGAPQQHYGDRIIDGSLVRGLWVSDGPNLMPRVASSDHRPYNETLQFSGAVEAMHPWAPKGDVKDMVAWWGFGDYYDDEIYDVWTVDSHGNPIPIRGK